MIQTEKILPIVKELVYSSQFETDDTTKLKSIIKFDRVLMDVMADALEAKADSNLFFISNLFRFYAEITKAYNFLFDTTVECAKVTKDDKDAIMKMLEELTDIEDAGAIIEKIARLPEPAMPAEGAAANIAVIQEGKELKSAKKASKSAANKQIKKK